MAWYNEGSIQRDVIVSTRARYARNLDDYPFDLSAVAAVKRELVGRVRAACEGILKPIELSGLSQIERLALCEEHYISPVFMDTQEGVLLSNEEKGIYLMTPEEDHIRLQVIGGGYDPEAVLLKADEILMTLSEKLPFSFDKKLGYLTHCPTNLGLGLRLSVMAFLPGIVHEKRIASLADSLSGLGFNLRGMYGEGSRSTGCLFQISNRYSLGVTQNEILSTFTSVMDRVIGAEREARREMNAENIFDSAGRAYGILRYAGRISYDEFLSHYATLRLGYAKVQGLPENCDIMTLDQMLVTVAPGMLTKAFMCKGSEERDWKRAQHLNNILKAE